jgi:acyl-CoA synthetase (AMP-forming)/AMP-acid ligase II
MVDSIIHRLAQNAKKQPKKDALTFLGSGPNGGTVEQIFTYNDIEKKTNQLALDLLSAGLSKGDL